MSNEGNITFAFGDIAFQLFSFLFIALIVTIIVIAGRKFKRKRDELKRIEARLNHIIDKNHLKE
ncbi:hypothetical protein BACPU_06000 [Bacillus pumilus]|nr:hypothetical protein BACPU_06000 [Bacillus pumilus]